MCVCVFVCVYERAQLWLFAFLRRLRHLCRDNSALGRHTFKRGICHIIQCTINPFLIHEDVVYLCFSVICVSISPMFSLSFLKFSI